MYNFFPNESLFKKKKKMQTTNVVWNLAPKELERTYQEETGDLERLLN